MRNKWGIAGEGRGVTRDFWDVVGSERKKGSYGRDFERGWKEMEDEELMIAI